MDEVADKVAGLGVGGLVLGVMMGTTGFAGAAALTTALAMLGGPWGMFGGVLAIGTIAAVAGVISQHGIDAFAIAVVKSLMKDGKSPSEIKSEIDAFPFISKRLKLKCKDYVDKAQEMWAK